MGVGGGEWEWERQNNRTYRVDNFIVFSLSPSSSKANYDLREALWRRGSKEGGRERKAIVWVIRRQKFTHVYWLGQIIANNEVRYRKSVLGRSSSPWITLTHCNYTPPSFIPQRKHNASVIVRPFFSLRAKTEQVQSIQKDRKKRIFFFFSPRLRIGPGPTHLIYVDFNKKMPTDRPKTESRSPPIFRLCPPIL